MIAIIGVLVALLLPAVQAARAAARRTQCLNQVRQIVVALQNYHSSQNVFPPGVINDSGRLFERPRLTWMMHTFGYLEQNTIAQGFNLDATAGCQGGVWLDPENALVVAVSLDMLLCPSDSEGDLVHNHPECGGTVSRGNYAGFFGNVSIGAATNEEHSPIEEREGQPNGHRDAVFTMNDRVGLRNITDGSSNTMMIGEVLKGVSEDKDYRGVHWYDHAGTSQIFTRQLPNSPDFDRLFPLWCSKNTNLPELNLPCRPGMATGANNYAASRSRHSGGVHVGMADGSAHFINDDVDLVVWQAMGSISHGEVFDLP